MHMEEICRCYEFFINLLGSTLELLFYLIICKFLNLYNKVICTMEKKFDHASDYTNVESFMKIK